MSQKEGTFTDNSKDFGSEDEQEHNVSTESMDITETEGCSDSNVAKSQQNQTYQQQKASKKSRKKKSLKERHKVKVEDLERKIESLEKELEAVREEKAEQAPCDCVARKRDYEMKLKEKEQEVKSVEEAQKRERDQFKKRIQQNDKTIQGLTNDSAEKNSLLVAHKGDIKNLQNRLKRLQQANEDLHNANAETTKTLNKEKEALYQEKKKLLLRLSKCAGDSLTYKNPDIADLSDEKRPTKLAEEFAELYDNEWTDAFENVNFEGDQRKTTFMLQLLKRANELCNEISENHAESIKRSFSSITVKSEVPLNGRKFLSTELNPGTSSKAEQEVSQEHRFDADNDNSNGSNGTEDAKADTDSTITCSKTDVDQMPHVEAKEDGIIPETNHAEADIASNFETDHVRNEDEEPKQKNLQLESDFELLQKEQKKPIMEARKFFEVQLSEKVEQAGSDIIVQELGIDQEEQGTVVSYVQKCMNICWSMCRHEPPVYVEFIDVGDDIPFDTNKYKPYTKSGKRLDYIVWPAVYLHKKGPMLSKGVAQGKS